MSTQSSFQDVERTQLVIAIRIKRLNRQIAEASVKDPKGHAVKLLMIEKKQLESQQH